MPDRRAIIKRVAIAATVLLIPTCYIWGIQDRTGYSPNALGAPLVDLPADATDVSWSLPGLLGPNMVYDFKTTEVEFHAWVRNSGRMLKGPTRGSFLILKYNAATAEVEKRQLENMIAYTQNEEDRGEYMVYDLDEGRAYFWSHSR